MKFLSSIFNTFFFTGMIPFAPGTMGSFFALLIWFIIQPSFIFMIISLFVVAVISYFTILFELKDSTDKDPQHIVIDEAIGMWISLLFISSANFVYILLSFVIFRLLDILKPSIIRRLDEYQGPLGILLDDIASGIITCMILIGFSSL